LVASGLTVEEVKNSIGADSLGFVSLEGLVAATKVAEDRLCKACFDGKYPIALPEDGQFGKNLLENIAKGVEEDEGTARALRLP